MARPLRQLATETIVYGLGGVLSGVMSALLLPLYAHVFPPKEYGIIGVVSTSSALLSVLVALGLDTATARWYWDTDDVSDRKATIASGFWCQIIVSTVLSAGIFAAAGPLARILLNDPAGPRLIRIVAATLPFSTFAIVAVEWFRMRRRPVAMVFFTVVTSAASAGLSALLILQFHWDVGAVYASNLVGSALGAGLAMLYLKDWIHPRYASSSRLRAMLAFSAPLVPASLSYWVLSLSDRVLLEVYLPLGQVGYYQVAATVSMGVGVLIVAFQQAWNPFAMSIHKEPHAKSVYANAFILYVLAASGLAATVSALAPEIIRVVAGARYGPSASSIPYLAFAAALTGVTYIGATGPSIVKVTKPIAVAMIGAAVVNVALNLLLIPVIGRNAAAISTLAAEASLATYLLSRSQKLFPVPYRFREAALVGAVSFVGSLALSHQHPRDLVIGVLLKIGALAIGFALLAMLTLGPRLGRLRSATSEIDLPTDANVG